MGKGYPFDLTDKDEVSLLFLLHLQIVKTSCLVATNYLMFNGKLYALMESML